MSRIKVHAVASVCHRILPNPTETASAVSNWMSAERRPKRRARYQAAHAAIRKDALLIAFSGSLSSPGSGPFAVGIHVGFHGTALRAIGRGPKQRCGRQCTRELWTLQ